MDKRENGFTLVELMITMVIFVLVIAGASQVFTGLLTQFKQQSKITETNIEGAVGLEMMRRDLESAGYGLAWNVEIDNTESPGDGNDWEQLVGYCEAVSVPPIDSNDPPDPSTFNNGTTNANCTTQTGGSQPMPIFSGNGSGVNGSDYLVIRATNVATNVTAHKWTYLQTTGPKTWTPACENLNKYPNAGDTNCSTGTSTENTVRVIVISPGGSTTANTRSLITSSAATGVFFTQYSGTSDFDPPTGSTDSYIIYGIKPADSPAVNPRMPFNRADYYVRRPAGNAMPSQCAPNTGVLYKATVNHADGGLTELPVLDCVADMQVVFATDLNSDGTLEYTGDLTGYSAAQIRTIKEVRLYILAHEGQRDRNYTYPAASITISDPGAGTLRTYDVSANRDYRWKIYTIFVKPSNL